MKKRGVRLKEIAGSLKLSISTVSRALNNHPGINEQTKARVLKEAKALNYHPNVLAKGFRSHRSHIIGVVVPKISHYYTSTMLAAIIETAEQQGYRVIVSESKHDPDKQSNMLNSMIQFGVDGILMSLTRTTKAIQDILNVLDRIPLVLFDKVSSKVPCTQVIIDEKRAAYNMVEHLIQQGKKKIAIIKESENSFNSEKRFEGYLSALQAYEIPKEEALILSTEDISIDQGRRLAHHILTLKNRPDAIFAITDGCAVGVIEVLKNNGIKIPEEIAVVGFSNSFSSTIVEPKLTTIDQPGSKVGRTAVQYLIAEIETEIEEEYSTKTVEIGTKLIVRASSLCMEVVI